MKMTRTCAWATWLLSLPATLATAATRSPDEQAGVEPLRIAVVGLVHGHVEGLLWNARERNDLELVGVYEPNRALFDRLAAKYDVDPGLYWDDLPAMLDATTPEAASVMTNIAGHRDAIEHCVPRGIPTLVEKPLAFSSADARRIADLASEHDVLVLTNYETSWYASLREVHARVASGEMVPVRRMVFRHGHPGPVEIGCSDEFLAWLTDPELNGGGAIVDFGCYGIALSTWLMDGQRPTSITAVASTQKPEVYPHVDDDSTIVLTYPGATAVVQGSWAWTHDNKEADFHTEAGSMHAGRWDELFAREPDTPAERIDPKAMPPHLRDEWTYLRQVVRGECEVDMLSSLELNVVVAEVLDEARRQIADQSD